MFYYIRILLLSILLIGMQASYGQAPSVRIDSLNELAFAKRVTDKEDAIQLSYRALAINKKQTYQKGYYKSCLNLGLLYTNLSRYDSAFHYLRDCQHYFEDDFNLGLTKYYLGINYSNLRDFNRAKALFIEAKQHFVSNENIEYQAYVDNSLGIIHGRLGEYPEALEWFLTAYSIKLENGLLYDEELTNISIVYRLLGQPEKSLYFLNKSLEISKNSNDSLGVAQMYISIGKVYASLESYDSALIFLDEAYAIAHRNDYDRQTASALTNKSAILVSHGNYTEAIELLQKAGTYVVEDDDVIESIYATLSDIYHDLGKLDSAISYAEKTFSIANKAKNLVMAQSMAKDLANMYESSFDYDKALHYQKMYGTLSDSLTIKNKESEIGDLRVSIETLEKDHEIAILNAEKEVQTLERERIIFALIATIATAGFIILLLIYKSREARRARQLKEAALKTQIEIGQEDLYRQTLHMIHVNNSLNEIEEQLKSKLDSQKILSTIRYNKSLDKDWDNFNTYFGNVHNGFNEQLTEIASDLTTHEKRVCALLKINLSNREIATILNIESKSVAMIKYRIKKKLDLAEDQDLVSYLQSLMTTI